MHHTVKIRVWKFEWFVQGYEELIKLFEARYWEETVCETINAGKGISPCYKNRMYTYLTFLCLHNHHTHLFFLYSVFLKFKCKHNSTQLLPWLIQLALLLALWVCLFLAFSFSSFTPYLHLGVLISSWFSLHCLFCRKYSLCTTLSCSHVS